MADIKTLQTRIALKYDTYANWTDEAKGANLVLLKGEIGLCEIPSGNAAATTAPTVLFKVGDGTTPFKSLKWASALAADVYGWAKSETVVLDGEVLKFKTGDVVNGSVDLSAFATDAVVEALAARVAVVEGKFSGDASVESQIDALDKRLDAIEGDDGAIASAVTEAKGYTDAREAAIKTAYEAYTDGKVDGLKTTLEAKDAELAGEITRVEGLVSTEATNRDNADKAINDKIGEGFDATNTVAVKVKAAQDAADAAQADVDALTAANGPVTKNTADITQLRADLANETTARDNADKALDERLDKIETFFAGAYDENGKALNEALDTLVEIQDYLDGDGDAAGTLVDKVAKNASDIADLQEAVNGNAAAIAVNGEAIESLQALTAGDYGTGTIKDAIDAAAAKGQQGIDDAKAAKDIADANKAAIEHETTGLAAIKTIADTATTDLAALTGRVEDNEDAIAALQGIVVNGDNSNDKLRNDLAALTGIVSNETTGLAATKAIADAAKQAAADNAADIAAIQGDYLKSADLFIFNCGTSTEVVHTAPAGN